MERFVDYRRQPAATYLKSNPNIKSRALPLPGYVADKIDTVLSSNRSGTSNRNGKFGVSIQPSYSFPEQTSSPQSLACVHKSCLDYRNDDSADLAGLSPSNIRGSVCSDEDLLSSIYWIVQNGTTLIRSSAKIVNVHAMVLYLSRDR